METPANVDNVETLALFCARMLRASIGAFAKDEIDEVKERSAANDPYQILIL